MSAIASHITGVSILYSIGSSDADQRKHKSPVSLAFVRGIHRLPVNSPHKGPVTQRWFPFDDVIMDHAMCHVEEMLTTFIKNILISNEHVKIVQLWYSCVLPGIITRRNSDM